MLPQNPEEEIDLSKKFRSEVNLLTRPYFALTTQDIFKRKKTEFETVVERGDEKLKISWEVSANPEYGYPGPFEKKVHRAIEQIIEGEGFPVENPIQFSIYGLCNRIGIHPGGKQYKRIKEAMERIITSTIKSKGAFYHKGEHQWIDDTFHLYERVVFKGKKLDDGSIAETNYLFLGSWYLQSLNARYVKPLDWNYYQSLDTNVARRLYELLSVKFYGIFRSNHPYICYRYTTLCQLLPLIKREYLSAVKQQLDPSHQELEETEFLEKVRWNEVKDKKKDWYIYYYPGPRVEEEIKRFEDPPWSAFKQGSKWDKPPLTQDQKADFAGWMSELTHELQDDQKKNEGFYKKLSGLIVRGKISQTVVRRCLAEAKSEDQMRKLDPDKEPIRNRSAYFTDLLKRRLNQKNRDLHELLQSA